MSYLQLHKVSYYFSVTESVIFMKFGELSYFGNFFDFGKVFGDVHPFGLGPEVKGKLGEIKNLSKSYMDYHFGYYKNILCHPPYEGVP